MTIAQQHETDAATGKVQVTPEHVHATYVATLGAQVTNLVSVDWNELTQTQRDLFTKMATQLNEVKL